MGEAAGLERLECWMFTHDRLQHYKQTRNGMLGESYSSKFSPWLATGCLSARTVVAETLRYEAERTANESTYWLRFELLWREYFRLYLLKHGPALFQRGGPAQSRLRWSDPPGHFEAWRNGCTGVPLIDANMIELARTGFMSNRGRQIVASFLAKNLDVDWRRGARWFEHCLIDYCPTPTGTAGPTRRGEGESPWLPRFRRRRQAANYDPEGDYIAVWLDESIAAQPIEQRMRWLRSGGADRRASSIWPTRRWGGLNGSMDVDDAACWCLKRSVHAVKAIHLYEMGRDWRHVVCCPGCRRSVSAGGPGGHSQPDLIVVRGAARVQRR